MVVVVVVSEPMVWLLLRIGGGKSGGNGFEVCTGYGGSLQWLFYAFSGPSELRFFCLWLDWFAL